MKKLVLACLGASLFCIACGHRPTSPAPNPADSLSLADSTQKTYFPIADVLESEILEVDSTPVAIKKIVIIAKRRDSAFIKPAEFNLLAGKFLAPEFRNGDFQKDFTETSFLDNSTQAATFTYSTTNRDLTLQRVDVIAMPQGSSHRIKSIYLETNRVSGDSSILEKMFWRTGKKFQIVSLINVKGQPPVERQTTVSWESGGDTDGDNE
jgi:hypothetical protein